jgi:hypothetical protein
MTASTSGKTMIGSTFWEKNIIGSGTFWETNIIGSTFWEKP